MRLVDRLSFRQGLYYEGMASGASVLMSVSTDANREAALKDLLEAAKQSYVTDGPVFACIAIRMMLMAEAVFKFRSKNDKHLFGNPDLSLLEEPWPNGTAGDLISRAVQDVDLTGNSYWWKTEDDLLWRLPPSEVIIVSQQVADGHGRKYRKIIGYEWDPAPPPPGTMQTTPPQHFEPDEIVHWSPVPDPAANFRGMSWMTPVLRDSYADSALTAYKTRYLDHGHPVSAIRYAQRLQPATIEAIQERLKNKYGGVSNAWQPLVLDQGADPVMGTALQQLDLRNVQAGGEQRICAAAGVPPIIIGLKNADTNETYQTAMRRFGDGTLRPLWRSLCAALEPLIPSIPAGVQLWYDTSDIAALQAAETERAQVTQVNAAAIITLVQAGYTRDSVIAAVTASDMGQLVADPNAPTPGVNERETINVADNTGQPVTGPGSGESSDVASVQRPVKTGSPPGGGQVLTQPQTPASKKPVPSGTLTPHTSPQKRVGAPRAPNPSANGRG